MASRPQGKLYCNQKNHKNPWNAIIGFRRSTIVLIISDLPRHYFCRLVLEDGSVWHGTAFGHTGSEGKTLDDTLQRNSVLIPGRQQGHQLIFNLFSFKRPVVDLLFFILFSHKTSLIFHYSRRVRIQHIFNWISRNPH
jgi:hypothetical protein